MSILTVQERGDQLVIDSRLIAGVIGHSNFEFLASIIWGKNIPLYLNSYEVLAVVRVVSLYDIKPEIASKWDLIKLAEEISCSDPAFAWVKFGILEGVSSDMAGKASELESVQGWFKHNFKKFFPSANLVPPYSINKKRPDCILDIDGTHYPVECKLEFSRNGLDQLKGYMKIWEVDKGVAVAKKFICKTPVSITQVLVSK